MRLLLALLLAAAPFAAASATPADVGAAVAMLNRPAEDIALDAGRKPAEVLAFERLEVGDRVLDWDAGKGYYAELMAHAVGPTGHVDALNPPAAAEASAGAWKSRLARNPNIALITSGFADAPLAPDTYNFALMNIVYHDLYWQSDKYHLPRVEPRVILHNLYRAMKAGGVVAVIDHVGPKGDPRVTADKLHRIDPETIRYDFERAGFRLSGQSKILRNPTDDHTKLVFDPAIRGHTDRVVYRFVK